MKKKVLIPIMVVITIIFLLYGVYQWMNARTFQVFGELVSQVETEEKVVALTFDDGPSENVDPILSLLDEYQAKATFFLIGKDLEKNISEGKKIAKAGHQIGNHTYSHQRMVLKSFSTIAQEIQKTNQWIRETGYQGEIDFRPPNGKKLIALPYYLKQHHIETITWDLEPETYFTSTEDQVNYVVNNVQPGSIILLHPMYELDKTLPVIEGILAALKKEGYQFKTVNQLQDLSKEK